MGAITDVKKVCRLLTRAWAARAAHRRVISMLEAQGPHPPHRYRVAVYFADTEVNMYQIRQWYGPLQAITGRFPVLVIARSPRGAEALLDDGALPVAFVPEVGQLEALLDEQDIHIVLYVNQNTRNFQMFRYGRRWHVFINHGESDKMYMTTNQYKAYDYAFIAGQAARDRLTRTLWDYDIDRRAIEIGRPQADHYSGILPYTPDDRMVVLYAPTWEGDRPSAHYGSIATHGEELMRALLASPRHRVIYRPHPRSGVVDEEYAAAHRRILAAISEANAADPGAHHVYDDGPELGWQLAAADVAIVDISAMVYDRLAAGKPLLITRPVDERASIDTTGYLSDCEWLSAAGARDIIAEADRVSADEEAVARLHTWVRHHFGDTAPGAATAKFHGAIEQLMHKRDQWHAMDTATEPDDEDDDDDDED
jgi:hypothetical protein